MGEKATTANDVSSESKSRTSFRFLMFLFVTTCYTTFWLPYPQARPNSSSATTSTLSKLQFGNVVPRHQPYTSIASSSGSSNSLRGVGRATLLHARASPEALLVYEPGLDRYYQQRGFEEFPWTKYVNIGALGFVFMWVLWGYVGISRGKMSSTINTFAATPKSKAVIAKL